MQDGHISVQTDTGQEKRRRVFDTVEEAQDVPGAAVGQIDDVCELQRRNETEESVQHGQMNDENVRCGRVAFILPNEPQNHDVGRNAQKHVDKLQHQVENEDRRHVCTVGVHGLLRQRDVLGTMTDEQRRVDESENFHYDLRLSAATSR